MYGMKRLMAILLVVLYSSLNIVSAINLHYCHGKLISFSINKSAKSCCESNTEIQASCCSIISIELELDNNQLVQNSLEIQSVKAFSILYSVFSKYSDSKFLAKNISVFITDSPPGESVCDIYLLNNSFLIYG